MYEGVLGMISPSHYLRSSYARHYPPVRAVVSLSSQVDSYTLPSERGKSQLREYNVSTASDIPRSWTLEMLRRHHPLSVLLLVLMAWQL